MTRPARPAREVATENDLVALTGPVRRVAVARLARNSGIDVDDVVQETLVRLWDARWRLERGALLAYGVVVARNLVASAERDRARQDRYAPRLIELGAPADPAAGLLAGEERAALQGALAALREDDRRLLVEHEVRGVDTGKLAAEEGISPGAVAARLARARARLRVEHLLTLRRVRLPTDRCRPVLDALSLGDRRRQRTLLAAEHLLGCPTCEGLAEPLLTRRRALTALAPIALLLAAPGKLWAWARANPWPAAGSGVTAAAVATAVAVAVTGSPPPRPAPPPPAAAAPSPAPTVQPATLSVAGTPLLPAGPVGSLRAHAGRVAVGRDVPVQAVVADEGFWVGAGPGRRVWVQLAPGAERAVAVRPGQRASFTAAVVPAPADFAARAGVTAAEGAAELRATGAYLRVDPERLTLR